MRDRGPSLCAALPLVLALEGQVAKAALGR
jgi:hypothetical protein